METHLPPLESVRLPCDVRARVLNITFIFSFPAIRRVDGKRTVSAREIVLIVAVAIGRELVGVFSRCGIVVLWRTQTTRPIPHNLKVS